MESDSGIKANHLPLHWMLYNGYEVLSDMKGDLEPMHAGNRISLPRSAPNNLPNIRNREQGHLQCDLSRPKDLLG